MLRNGWLLALLSALTMAMTDAPAQRDVEAPGPNGPLAGTLTMPASAPLAAILLIPGSGPTDRDGNNRLGVRAATLRLLAEGLAAKGIASIRIDKRGMFGSAAAIPDANDVTIGAYADDVHAWARVLRAETGLDCAFLLGHSEGALVALAAAQKADGICGLVLAAAPGRRLGTVLRAQLSANPANAPILKQAFAALDTLERGERFDTADLNPALLPLFNPQVQGFLIDMLRYDPAALLADYDGPVLLLAGGRDLQVGAADIEALAAADPAAKVVTLPHANHVLKQVPSDDPAANLAAYADPDLPLAPGLVEAIAAFVDAHRR